MTFTAEKELSKFQHNFQFVLDRNIDTLKSNAVLQL
jgi:hypothetical protein